MDLIMTIDDSDEENVAAASSDDDDDFELGKEGVHVDVDDPSASGKWATARAHSKVAKPTKKTSLDDRLAARAAARPVEPQPEIQPEEEAVSAQTTGRERKKAKKASKKGGGEGGGEGGGADAGAAADGEDDDPLTLPEATSFSALQLSKPLLKAVWELGFAAPTPIQAAVMPPALRGVDICASAVTGSGKTAAFLLPALERLLHRPRRIAATRVLVLVPTRELGAQCEEMGRQLGRFTDVRFSLVCGGLSLKAQEADMRTRPDVVVGTPGRLIDLLRNAPSFGLEELEILVLDEADRLLELGFEQEVNEVVRACPRSRQTMLFSATISSAVLSLAKLSLDAPLQLKVDPTFNVAETLQQEFVRLRPQKEHEREAVLLALASRTFTSHTIIFLPTKVIAHRLKVLFGLFGLRAAELHGNLTQTQRLQALDDFREAKADFLLATDLAGRGLDIRGVKTVINYTLPTELKSYVHRVGRTARAGTEGRAVSIVCERDRAFLKRVLKHAAEVVRTRTVPNESISHWVERIAGVEEEVTEVMQEEREEKALQAAERDAIKASNMIEHRDEIMSRPARSWFQTDKEKQAAKEASKAQQPTSAAAALASAGDDDPKGGGGKRSKSGRDGDGGDSKGGEARKKEVKRDKFAGMTRKKRRALQRAELFEGEEGGASLPNQKAIARGYKSAAKRAGGTHDGHRKRSAQELGMLQTGGTDRGGEGKAKKQRTTEASPRPHATAPAEGAGGGKDVKKVPKKLKSHSKAKFSKPRKRR